jgi:D-glycero-D-manno-heptose 1,7-bisphosphate phosphatase
VTVPWPDGQTGAFPAARTPKGRRALFADRDGTLIQDAHYLRDPALVELLPGAVALLREFAAAGWAIVVVTNQSGIAQGIVSEADYLAVRARLDQLLDEQGVRIDLTKHCPHHPDKSGPCRCRKPGTLMYEEAAESLGLDLAGSVYVGDRWRDVAPALTLGGRGFLVRSPDTPEADWARAKVEAEVADALHDVIERVLR